MTEERITETETPTGNVHTTHTVVTDDGPRARSGSGWLIALVVLLVAVAGIWLFTQQSQSEVAKDNAVAQAADGVADAAGKVGDAAQEVVDGE